MTTDHRTCIRGCARANRHTEGCRGDDCRGCQPRRVDGDSHLCRPCRMRLTQWLSETPQQSLVWVHGWLTERLGGISSTATRQDYERPVNDGPPTPVRLEIYDQRQLLTDRLFIAEERVREWFDRPAIENFTVASACTFLRNWLVKIETEMPPEFMHSPATDDVGQPIDRGLWGKLAETMRDSHALAPWRAEVQRLPGMPCPECDHKDLVIYGGETDVTCRSCQMMYDRSSYDRWAQLIAYEKQAGAA